MAPGGDGGRRGGRDALEMLGRSHRRLEEALDDLERAAGSLAAGRSGVDHAGVVDDVLGFLERSVARHERDEEESLFPRLRGHADLEPLLDRLTAEHARHEALGRDLVAARGAWPATGPTADDGARLVAIAGALATAYQRHIDLEERELLPAARARLSAEELEAVRGDMDRRRGR